jgi:hypothetical protein
MNPTFLAMSKSRPRALVVMSVLACTEVNTTAASLFGDLSCEAWANLDQPTKKTWTNAFLAPLSLTHQGLARTKQDRYNDDPKAVDPAVVSIDKFCLSHPKSSSADGAIAYLNTLIEN